MDRFANKVLFITGSLSGLGGTLAVAAAQEGATVVAADWHRKHYDAVQTFLELFGQESAYISLNTADGENVQHALTTVEQRFGRIDIVLNCPAASQLVPGLRESPTDGWGYLRLEPHCVTYEVAHFMRQGGGVIVNLIPLLGGPDDPGFASHYAAVHAALSLAATMAAQYGAHDIRINTLSPYCAAGPSVGSPPESTTLAGQLANAAQEIKAFLILAAQESPPCNGIHWVVPAGY